LSILAIDASGARAGVAVLGDDGVATVKLFAPGRPGLIETLPRLLQQAVAEQNISAVAVTIGPGSFTGLRTAISLAQGFAAAAGLPLIGVTVAEAFLVAFPVLDRPLWIAIRARRDRIFLARGRRWTLLRMRIFHGPERPSPLPGMPPMTSRPDWLPPGAMCC